MPTRSFSTVPGFQTTSFTPQQLEQLLIVLKAYDVKEMKFTSTGRLSVLGLSKETCTQLAAELIPLFPKKQTHKEWFTYIQACPGMDSCKFGVRDGEALAAQIEKIKLPGPLRAKMKIGIAGCQMCCTEPYVRDLGILAERKGWKIIFGGNAGGRARVGDVIAEGLTDDQVVELIRRCLIVYQDNAGAKVRSARFLESFGVNRFKKAVLSEPF